MSQLEVFFGGGGTELWYYQIIEWSSIYRIGEVMNMGILISLQTNSFMVD